MPAESGRLQSLLAYETKRHTLLKFVAVVLLLLIYFAVTARRFGAQEGLFISALTWSFFVFCTPIADAGALLDLPLRLLTGIRMLYAEMAVWAVSLGVLVSGALFAPGLFEKTLLLQLYEHIIADPWPNWLIIGLSAVGTFLSVLFGDELLDVSLHRERETYHRYGLKHQLIILLFLIVLVLILYDFLLKSLGIDVPL